MNLEHIAQISFKLFWIIDIIGGLPIFISLMNRFGKIQTEKAALVSACFMIIFLFAGEAMLRFLDIPLKVFAVAGAFILLIIAVEMILGVSFHKMEEANSISIVPIAFPLLAGPGVLTMILSLHSSYSSVDIVISILINVAIAYIVIKHCRRINDWMGQTGIVIANKIAGVILLALSIKMFADNWKTIFE